MADSKLSALAELTVKPAATDEFYINDGGISKRIVASNVIKDHVLIRTGDFDTATLATSTRYFHPVGDGISSAASNNVWYITLPYAITATGFEANIRFNPTGLTGTIDFSITNNGVLEPTSTVSFSSGQTGVKESTGLSIAIPKSARIAFVTVGTYNVETLLRIASVAIRYSVD